MLYFDIAISGLVMLFCALTVAADVRGKNMGRLLFKVIASMLFLFIGFILVASEGTARAAALFAALLACVFGDVFLAYYDADRTVSHNFIYGISAFSAAQIFFSVYTVISFGTLLPWSIIAAVLLTALGTGAIFVFKIKPGRLLAICSAYMLLLSWAFCAAVFALIKAPCLSTALLAAGSLLFVISDTILLFKYFKASSGVLTAFNLITYYLGVVLIALSPAAAL